MMGFSTIAGGGLSLSKEHVKEWRKRRQWVRPSIRKKDSKGAYYSIMNDIRLTDKEDSRKYRSLKQNILFHKIMCFHFFCTVKVDIKKFLTTHACFCFFVMEFSEQKNMLCTSEASLWFTQKNNFFIMNKIKLVWFYSLYRNYFFE